MTTYSDEHLEHWGRVYVDRRVQHYGIQFEFFLLRPHHILQLIDCGRLIRLGFVQRSEFARSVRETVRHNLVKASA